MRFRFNPRLPGGRRLYSVVKAKTAAQFQSTPSGGKATSRPLLWLTSSLFQSTPSGGKATDQACVVPQRAMVSIHAFRGEGDMYALIKRKVEAWFQSTPSGGKATYDAHSVAQAKKFQSTPSGGKATSRRRGGRLSQSGFNPRLPGGRRHSRHPQRRPS